MSWVDANVPKFEIMNLEYFLMFTFYWEKKKSLVKQENFDQ